MKWTQKVVGAVVVAVTAVTLGLIDAGPATALTADTLGCYVTPSRIQPTLARDCFDNGRYATSYQATFQVASPTHSYTYAWSVPSGYVSFITSGCTATSSVCVLGNLAPVQLVTVSVTLSLNGTAVSTQSSTADIEPWCSPTVWCG